MLPFGIGNVKLSMKHVKWILLAVLFGLVAFVYWGVYTAIDWQI